ncbi:MAG: hypothetical protein QM640_07145 [Niabella sp.]
MIAFSLVFITILLLILSSITSKDSGLVIAIATTIMLGAIIPWRASKR